MWPCVRVKGHVRGLQCQDREIYILGDFIIHVSTQEGSEPLKFTFRKF